MCEVRHRARLTFEGAPVQRCANLTVRGTASRARPRFKKHSAGFLLCGYPVATSPSWKVEKNFVGDGAILVETAWDVSLLVGAFPKKLDVEISRWRILVVFCCWLLRVYLIADIHRIFARDTNFHIRPCSRQVICARCGITRARRRFWGALSQRRANLKVRGCTRAKARKSHSARYGITRKANI